MRYTKTDTIRLLSPGTIEPGRTDVVCPHRTGETAALLSPSPTGGTTMTTPRTTPPFRADHVGSLLRPKELQDARAKWKAGTLPPDALRGGGSLYCRRNREAGKHRPARRDRRRIPPRLLAL